jgi:exopolysaccharide biosynthesis predicted pyruvyltransferase EpsI
LTYFIGGRSNRVNTDLKKYAEENNMEIYNLMDYAQPDLFVAGPSEFIYLIAHSQLVMTDSFHACVFSFLFQKPFLVYDRKGKENNMMSRMDTLLEKFDLKRKYVDSELINEILECDYSIGFKQLQFERQKAESFLRNSLNLDK